MAKTKALVISGPYDARHVGGANIPGVMMPMRDFTFEPESEDEKENRRPGERDAPKRSSTFSQSLRDPGLRFRSSISRLRSRSSSNSRSGSRDGLRRQDSVDTVMSTYIPKRMPPQRPNVVAGPPPPPPPPPPQQESSPLRSTARSSSSNLRSAFRANSPPKYQSKVPNRPKRADSGTAIDFSDTPATERPMGFKEIMAVESYEERMALYKKTREYWAVADHGLGEWVGRVGGGRV